MDTTELGDVKKLRVAQLKAALSARGLDTSGKRADLLKRLQDHLDAATPPPSPSADKRPGDDATPPPSKRRRAGSGSGSGSQDNEGETGDPGQQGKKDHENALGKAAAAPAAAAGGGAAGPGAGPGASAGAGGAAADDDDSSSDDDFGPALPAPKPVAKKRVLKHERSLLETLPSASLYEKSYMHRDRVTHTVVAPRTDFVISASADGHVKFWKKMWKSVEFVKHYRAHLGAVTGLAVSADGLRLCSVGDDSTMKLYDVLNFDMVNMIKLPFVPSCCCWCYAPGTLRALVAVADAGSPLIRIYSPESEEVVATLSFHRAPVKCIAYCAEKNVAISADVYGVIEYWDGSTFEFPQSAVKFKFKMDTDLFDLAKTRARPTSLAVAPNGKCFAVSASDAKVRVFYLRTGKLRRTYDEGIHVFTDAQRDGSLKIDAMDFGRRVAVEKDLNSSTTAPPSNVVIDQTGNFLLFPTLAGIQVINIVTNKLVRVLGQNETTERFLALSLYQGIPKVDSQFKKAGAQKLSSDEKVGPDPTLVATSFKKNRVFFFSTREPDESDPAGRDVFNEAPSKDHELVLAESERRHMLGKQAVLHTTMGDITIKLFGDECPRTVENFSTHSRRGYYNNCVFHRVIKDFMIQTGDPGGDGTGGESIWGGDFEDEFHHDLRHDRAFTVSMANAGPGTNGSQFFITTVAASWLDNKHTVFGRVTSGMDTVKKIEGVKTNKSDRPLDEIKILSVTVT